MAEVVFSNEKLIPVIRRFGIELGFQNKTIEEISRENESHLDLLLLVMNLFNDDTLRNQSVKEISMIPGLINYLKAGHRYYADEKLPYIHSLIEQFVKESKHPKSGMLLDFFKEYRKEFIDHIDFEDQKVYPYIQDLYLNYRNKDYRREYCIKDYIDHHTDIEEKLTELKLLLIKYFPPTEQGKFHRDLILLELFNLEYDLNDHSNLEDDVLVSLVKMLEEAYENRK